MSNDFENFINSYDFICLSETKLTDYDSVFINDYDIHVLNKYNKDGKCEGIHFVALLVKHKYSNYVKIVKGLSKCALWCHIDSRLTGENILLGSLYIPPETSKHSCIEIFDDIEHDILELTSDKERSIILAGDLNARIGRLSDVDIDEDQTRLEFLNYCQPVNLGSFPYIRHTQDNTINRYGQRLIKLCKSVNIYILNGRTGQDKYTGRFTSKNSSVVDFIIVSPEVTSMISDFAVQDIEVLFSHIHCPVTCEIKFKYENSIKINKQTNEIENDTLMKPKWDTQKRITFLNELDRTQIDAITNR